MSLFDVATCPKLGSHPLQVAQPASKKVPWDYSPPRRRPPSHVPTYVLYRQPAKFLSRGKEKKGEREKEREEEGKGCASDVPKNKGTRRLEELLFAGLLVSFERVRRFERKFSSFRSPRCIFLPFRTFHVSQRRGKGIKFLKYTLVAFSFAFFSNR